jgi:hypothetical protein
MEEVNSTLLRFMAIASIYSRRAARDVPIRSHVVHLGRHQKDTGNIFTFNLEATSIEGLLLC